MTLLVFGKSGQLARELHRNAGARPIRFAGRDVADFNNPAQCVDLLQTIRPSAVINAVAYTAVDAAEENEPEATRINATTPGALAQAAAQQDIPFVQVSTEYVFDGSGTAPWPVDAVPRPLGAYGRSKLAGEQAVRAAGGRAVILRTSWVVSAHGRNFLKTMLRLGTERDRLSIVRDQIGGPTCAADLAGACLRIADALATDAGTHGTYHFSGGPDVSWAAFAREIFAAAGLDCAVEDIPTAAYPTPARRPLNSRLDNSRTEEIFGLGRPDWRAGIRAILAEMEVASA